MKFRFTDRQKEILIELGNWATNYISPITIGPDSQKQDLINSAATCSFVDTGESKIIVTNYHVLSKFYEFRKSHDDALFRIGTVVFRPEERLIDSDDDGDLVTFSISDDELLRSKKQCCSTSKWPPNRPEAGESVICAAFIGKLRHSTAANSILFEMLSMIEIVKSSSENQFVIYLDKEAEKKIYGYRDFQDIKDLGGMSGTVVLRAVNLNGIMTLEPIGIIFEYSSTLDLILCRHIDFLNSDGTIRKSVIRSKNA